MHQDSLRLKQFIYNNLKNGENLPKKMKRSLKERHTETYLIYFEDHRCLSQSEENKYMWKHGNDGAKWHKKCITLTHHNKSTKK